MDNSALIGIALASIMIFLMFLPNFFFKLPENHEEISDKYIKEMIRKSEKHIDKDKTL